MLMAVSQTASDNDNITFSIESAGGLGNRSIVKCRKCEIIRHVPTCGVENGYTYYITKGSMIDVSE